MRARCAEHDPRQTRRQPSIEERMDEARRLVEHIGLLNAEEAAVARLVGQYHLLAQARQQAGYPHVVPAVDNALGAERDDAEDRREGRVAS